MKTLSQMLGRISEIKAELKHAEVLKLELDSLRQDLLLDMQIGKSKRTESFNGVYAVRVEKNDVKVTNSYDVENWLQEEGFDMTEYKRLDMTRVNPLLKAALKEHGELVPGTEVVTSEYITFKED